MYITVTTNSVCHFYHFVFNIFKVQAGPHKPWRRNSSQCLHWMIFEMAFEMVFDFEDGFKAWIKTNMNLLSKINFHLQKCSYFCGTFNFAMLSKITKISPYILCLSVIRNYDTASNIKKHPINFAKDPSYFTLHLNFRS